MSATKELYEQEEKVLEVVDVQSVERAVYNDKWSRRLLRIGVEDRGTHCRNFIKIDLLLTMNPFGL
jgi:hypothetical protein